MSMNQTPEASRARIAIFGRANAGKSSLLNALTGQSVSIVSARRGTTTDPVKKAMELLPLGPVTLIDTAGLDDDSALGRQRVARAMRELPGCDILLFVADGSQAPTDGERAFLAQARQQQKPLVIAANKADLGADARWEALAEQYGARLLPVSASTGEGVQALLALLAGMKPDDPARLLVRDLVGPGQACVLVTPIDPGAPKGRLILPQQQVIRDLLEGGAIPVVTRDVEYGAALGLLNSPPALVVTDSQVFGAIARQTPKELPLTSFSMLFARYKGDLDALVAGTETADSLRDGDAVLVSEGCTHHRQCEDIGTVKIPGWLRAHTGAQPEFHFTSGGAFPEDLSPYKLVVHCGGCMLTAAQMRARVDQAQAQGVPMVNYGVLIAHMNGILARCLEPLRG